MIPSMLKKVLMQLEIIGLILLVLVGCIFVILILRRDLLQVSKLMINGILLLSMAFTMVAKGTLIIPTTKNGSNNSNKRNRKLIDTQYKYKKCH